MPVDRDLWTQPFLKYSNLTWLCPSCKSGHIKIGDSSKSIILQGTKKSNEERQDRIDGGDVINNGGVNIIGLQNRFSALFVCDNRHCQEPFVVSGIATCEQVPEEEGGNYGDSYLSFQPEYISPSPELVPLRKEYPLAVQEQLRNAFIHSWKHYAASLNCIRSSVEAILNHFNEPKERIGGGYITLEERIKKANCLIDSQKELLEATKWLGNEGSHDDATVTREIVFNALDILDGVLNELFPDSRHVAAVALAKDINKNKGSKPKPQKVSP